MVVAVAVILPVVDAGVGDAVEGTEVTLLVAVAIDVVGVGLNVNVGGSV